MLLWTLLIRFAHANEEGEAISFDPVTFFFSASWEVKLVMLVLVAMTLGTIVVFIERLIMFLRSRSHSVAIAMSVVKPLQANDPVTALQLTSKPQYKAGHLTALLRAGLTEIIDRPTSMGLANADRAIEKAESEQNAKLKRWFAILATTGSTAPFVGLAGTTRGVISAFTAMGTEGAGLSSISIGISEALWTTFFGIVVAILGVWAFNFFNGRLEKVNEEMDTARKDFLNWASKYVADGGIPGQPGADSEPTTDEVPADAAPAAGK
ncbi:MAG: MotA/TolQ/ExbB proton channel family protein [Myxococcota bacterium]